MTIGASGDEVSRPLGRYKLERVLGKGAMGVVYEGLDPRLGRRVAIKTILKANLDEDTGREFAMRFVREAQAVARLNHPNIVQVYDFGEEGDVAYIVMEFIRGKELKNFFDANERFELKEAVRIMGELCDALDFAHNAGIVHRDVKPANVMIDAEGRTKLTDFGVARVQDNDKTSVEKTQAGTMVGTPAYMSPEQIGGGSIDKRSDVFSAGIILYQFLTGEKPFTGSGAWTIAKKIIQEDPPAPSTLNSAITPLFDAVVNKALAKGVDERFQSARVLRIALERALQGQGPEDDSDRTLAGGIDLDASLRDPAPRAPSPSAAARSSPEVELEFWRAIKDGNDPDDFELYIQQFPSGIYAALARRKIAKLKGTASPEDETRAREQERSEAAEAARKEAEALASLAEEKEKLQREFAQKEEEYRRREAEREAAEKAEFAKREAELRKRVEEAESKPGGRKAAIRLASIVGAAVLAVALAAVFYLPKEDTAKLEAMQKQLEESMKKTRELEQAQERAKRAEDELARARAAEEAAKQAGDTAKAKALAQARLNAEAEAQRQAQAAKAAQRQKEIAEKAAAQARRQQAEAQKLAEAKRRAEAEAAAARAAAERAAAEKAAAEKLAAERAALEAERRRIAAEKAAAEKAAAEAKAAAEKAARERAAAAANRGGADRFQVAAKLEDAGKGREAVRAYIRAARGGSCEAAKRLGEIYDRGLIGIARDYAESLRWFNFARTLGSCEVPIQRAR